jgi:hypothetical protein
METVEPPVPRRRLHWRDVPAVRVRDLDYHQDDFASYVDASVAEEVQRRPPAKMVAGATPFPHRSLVDYADVLPREQLRLRSCGSDDAVTRDGFEHDRETNSRCQLEMASDKNVRKAPMMLQVSLQARPGAASSPSFHAEARSISCSGDRLVSRRDPSLRSG